MAEVVVEGELGSDIEASWALVGDFGGFIEALGIPVELEGEGIGQTRKISMGAEPTVERLEELDPDGKRLVYSIVSGPLPIRDYRSTMTLSDLGGGRTKLHWAGTFEPAEGSSEEDAANIVRSVYQGGLGGLQAKLGS